MAPAPLEAALADLTPLCEHLVLFGAYPLTSLASEEPVRAWPAPWTRRSHSAVRCEQQRADPGCPEDAELHQTAAEGPVHQQQRGRLAQSLHHGPRAQAQHRPWTPHPLQDRIQPGGQGGPGPVGGFDGLSPVPDARLQVPLQGADAGELRMGPLIQQLAHHPALGTAHGAVGRIAAVPVRHRQGAAGLEHPQHLVGVALLVRHVGAGLHAPDGIESPAGCPVGQLQGERIHDGEAAGRQVRWGEVPCPGDLGRTDADAEDVETVVPGQDPGAATDAAAHVEHPAAGGSLSRPLQRTSSCTKAALAARKSRGPGGSP